MNNAEKAAKCKEHLALQFDVPITSIVWMGNDQYIIVDKDHKEIRVTYEEKDRCKADYRLKRLQQMNEAMGKDDLIFPRLSCDGIPPISLNREAIKTLINLYEGKLSKHEG